MLPDGVMLALTTGQGEGVTGSCMPIAVTLPADPLVDGVVEPGVAVSTGLAGQPCVAGGARALLHGPRPGEAE